MSGEIMPEPVRSASRWLAVVLLGTLSRCWARCRTAGHAVALLGTLSRPLATVVVRERGGAIAAGRGGEWISRRVGCRWASPELTNAVGRRRRDARVLPIVQTVVSAPL
ncbi:MAG: hypothetical protein ACRCYX_07775 [Dermatophilaceae bacterium]